jgi:hypothetical protein
MRYLKILGLAVAAVTAMIAIGGAGSASATVFCKENATPCPAEKKWGAGVEFSSSLESAQAVIKAGVVEVRCSTSTMAGTISNAGGESASVIVKLETFSFGNCNCPVTTLKAGSVSAAWTPGTMNGGLTTANTELTFNCMGHCVYGEGPLGALTGGAMATIDVEGTMKKISGPGTCPASAAIEADYTVNAPAPLYVAEK